MVSFDSPVVVLRDREGAFIINLHHFMGSRSAPLARIPEGVPGIYAWIRNIRMPDSPDMFESALMEEISNPKFAAREGLIKPYYGVRVSSQGELSSGKKQRLQGALKQDGFRKDIRNALGLSVLLQAPLYIGKTNNLRRRISEHLDDESLLRKRFADASIDIDSCSILIFPIDSNINPDEHEEDSFEDLYEEIFSRLFLPQFSLRIG
jgi:hypothetical protein